MLAKARRLMSLEVTDVLKRGRSSRGIYLSIKYVSNLDPLRTSVIVPKSVAKGAVERNSLRRATYHALAPFSGSGNAIIFVQKKPNTHLQARFSEDLTHLLRHTA